MAATRYGFLELWDDLEKLFNTFNTDNTTPASSKEDDEAFELAHKAIREMIADGRASQAIAIYWDPALKAKLGLKAKNAFLTNFGQEQTPPIKGIKSLALLREVILPHIENAQKIEYDTIFTWLCSFVGIDVEVERKQAAQLAEDYRRIIAHAELEGDVSKVIVGEQFRLFSSSSAVILPEFALEENAVVLTSSADESSLTC